MLHTLERPGHHPDFLFISHVSTDGDISAALCTVLTPWRAEKLIKILGLSEDLQTSAPAELVSPNGEEGPIGSLSIGVPDPWAKMVDFYSIDPSSAPPMAIYSKTISSIPDWSVEAHIRSDGRVQWACEMPSGPGEQFSVEELTVDDLKAIANGSAPPSLTVSSGVRLNPGRAQEVAHAVFGWTQKGSLQTAAHRLHRGGQGLGPQ